MNAANIYYKNEKCEEVPSKLWMCIKCNMAYQDRYVADICCTKRICECGKEVEDQYYIKCRECIDKDNDKKYNDTLLKAKEVDKFIYVYDAESDKYFASIEELLDYYDNEGNNHPKWAFDCIEHTIESDDLPGKIEDFIIEHMNENHFEDSADYIIGMADLLDFINKWVKKQSIISYTPNYNNKIRIKGE